MRSHFARGPMFGCLLLILAASDPGDAGADLEVDVSVEVSATSTAATVVTTATTTAAQTAAQGPHRWAVSVVLMGPGEELFSRWGHIGIRVDDNRTGHSRVFNHGTFGFSGAKDLLAYAKGFLRFHLSSSSWRSTQWSYTAQDRDVWVCPMRIDAAQEARAVTLLEENLLPENRYYAYRHYLDNCTTRTRDLFEAVAAQSLAPFRDDAPTGNTFRTWTRQYLIGTPVMRSLILFALGPSVDGPITRWEEHFLPDLLVQDLRMAVGPDGQPLFGECQHVVQRQGRPPQQQVAMWEQCLIVGFVLALIAVLVVPLLLRRGGVRRRLHGLGFILWSLLGGGGGLVLAAFWLFTEHDDTWGNENLLAFVPLHIWLLVPGFKLLRGRALSARTLRILRAYFIAALILIVTDVLLKLGPFIQDNWAYLAFAAALNLLLFGAVRLMPCTP